MAGAAQRPLATPHTGSGGLYKLPRLAREQGAELCKLLVLTCCRGGSRCT